MSTTRFTFKCQRSGNCCKTGHGYVWVEESELAGIAAAKHMAVQAFVDFHVVRVGERLSIREGSHGRCSLLEGSCECSVYQARPAQCRDFPFWDKILTDRSALQAAARYCPGITIEC